MLKKLSETFTATHLTAILIAAMVTPGAVYAVTESNVLITDAKSGVTAYVDPTHHLNTYDPIAGYANNPANYVVLAGNCTANQTTNIFTVPAGKALILKTMHMAYGDGTANFKNTALFTDNNTGIYLAQFIDLTAAATFQADFGSGFYIHAGDGISCQSTVTASFTTYGYYVPASAVPAN